MVMMILAPLNQPPEQVEDDNDGRKHDDHNCGDDFDDGDGEDGDLLALLPWHKTTLLSGHRLTNWLLDLCAFL